MLQYILVRVCMVNSNVPRLRSLDLTVSLGCYSHIRLFRLSNRYCCRCRPRHQTRVLLVIVTPLRKLSRGASQDLGTKAAQGSLSRAATQAQGSFSVAVFKIKETVQGNIFRKATQGQLLRALPLSGLRGSYTEATQGRCSGKRLRASCSSSYQLPREAAQGSYAEQLFRFRGSYTYTGKLLRIQGSCSGKLLRQAAQGRLLRGKLHKEVVQGNCSGQLLRLRRSYTLHRLREAAQGSYPGKLFREAIPSQGT